LLHNHGVKEQLLPRSLQNLLFYRIFGDEPEPFMNERGKGREGAMGGGREGGRKGGRERQAKTKCREMHHVCAVHKQRYSHRFRI